MVKNPLAVNIAGVKFKNPLIAASGTFGYGLEYSEIYDVSKIGGISLKGLTLLPKEGNDSPRIAETPSGILNSVGLQNPGTKAFVNDYMPKIKKLGTVLIANIAGNTLEEYAQTAKIVSASGVDMIELNISCPNVKQGGMAFGVEPDSVRAVTEKVKENSSLPLIVKLTPNVSDITKNAAAAQKGGADAISLINTISGMAVDYKTRRPVLKNVTGGLSGPAVKPVALKMVWQVYNTVDIPIIGMGGIISYTDVLEFIICGASAVQIGTANIYNPTAMPEILADLERYFKENNLTLEELKGTLIV